MPVTKVANSGAMPSFPANRTIDPSRARNFSTNSVSVYGQDMIALTPHWNVLAGTRFDSMDANCHTGYDTHRKDNVWSCRTGLIYQPTDTQSYYASYGTSFNPSADIYVLDPMGGNTPPEKSRNMEIGAKWDLPNGDLMLRTALFRTKKTNLWTTYKPARGWRIGGFNSVGQRILNCGTTKTAPGYTRWDALLEYAFEKYTIQRNVFNLFNQGYANAPYPAFFVPGTDRAAQLTLNHKF